MESIGSAEVQTNLAQLLERVAGGEEFTIVVQG